VDYIEPLSAADGGRNVGSAIAVACLRRLVAQEYLQKFLEWYITNRLYYYDVVCWLDRLLYAQEPLRQTFERKLPELRVGADPAMCS
jgi:hypothetical protein